MEHVQGSVDLVGHERLNNPLIPCLDDICSSRPKKLNLDLGTEILWAFWVTRGIIEEEGDIEGDAFFLTVVLHSWHEFFGEPFFKLFASDPCTLICSPDDR